MKLYKHHIIVNERMIGSLLSAGVLHEGSNLSYHSPIYAKFDISGLNVKLEQNIESCQISWSKADQLDKENFKNLFEEKLCEISYNLDCSDVHCSSELHKNHLEDLPYQC